MTRFSTTLAAVGLMTCATAHGGDWLGKAEAGYVMARGNTDTDSANAKIDVAYEVELWKHSLYAAALYGMNNEIKSAERWETRLQSDYKLTERVFVFGALRYEQDHFSGFDYQGSATVGVGYKFIDTEATKLTGTLGGGYRRLRPEQLIKDDSGQVIQRIPGEESSEFVGNAGAKFEHQLTASTKILDTLLVESGSTNTFAQNDLSLEVSMTDTLALALGYSVRHNTDPPPGLEKTDRLTTVNLVYNLK